MMTELSPTPRQQPGTVPAKLRARSPAAPVQPCCPDDSWNRYARAKGRRVKTAGSEVLEQYPALTFSEGGGNHAARLAVASMHHRDGKSQMPGTSDRLAGAAAALRFIAVPDRDQEVGIVEHVAGSCLVCLVACRCRIHHDQFIRALDEPLEFVSRFGGCEVLHVISGRKRKHRRKTGIRLRENRFSDQPVGTFCEC